MVISMKKVFKGRSVVPGTAKAPALVSHGGFNTLASYQISLILKKPQAVCGDQNNADIYKKVMSGKALCLPKTIGSTTGGLVMHTAASMDTLPAAMLFSESIDSLAAAGAILADVWTTSSMPAIDRLGAEFLEYVKDGMTITVEPDGTVTVED